MIFIASQDMQHKLQERLRLNQSADVAKIAFARMPTSRVRAHVDGIHRGFELAGVDRTVTLLEVRVRYDSWLFEMSQDELSRTLDERPLVWPKRTRGAHICALSKARQGVLRMYCFDPLSAQLYPDMVQGSLAQVRDNVRAFVARWRNCREVNIFWAAINHPDLDEGIWADVCNVQEVHK